MANPFQCDLLDNSQGLRVQNPELWLATAGNQQAAIDGGSCQVIGSWRQLRTFAGMIVELYANDCFIALTGRKKELPISAEIETMRCEPPMSYRVVTVPSESLIATASPEAVSLT